MKKEKNNYTSPALWTIEVMPRSVIAASLTGSTEGADSDSGFFRDGYGTENINEDGGEW